MNEHDLRNQLMCYEYLHGQMSTCIKRIWQAIDQSPEDLRLMDTLIADEGLKLEPYRCSSGKLTIGVGRNLEQRGITKEEAIHLLCNDIYRIKDGCRLSKRVRLKMAEIVKCPTEYNAWRRDRIQRT